MKHFASPSFWSRYDKLPREIQTLADKNFELLKANPKHPSLHFKKAGKYFSALLVKNIALSEWKCRREFSGFGLEPMRNTKELFSSKDLVY